VDGEVLRGEHTTVTVETTDEGGGIDEVRLYQNGKLVSSEERGMKGIHSSSKVSTRTFDVLLVPGSNEFTATAFSSRRTESRPFVVTVQFEGTKPGSDLYILSVGINEYKNSRYNLNFGRQDAQAFAGSLEEHGKGIYRKTYAAGLYDDQTSKMSIENTLGRLAGRIRASDVFVLFYAGHGVTTEGSVTRTPDFYLVPYDVTHLYGEEEKLAESAISARELKEWCMKIKAQKQLIVIDACQSGGAVETFASRGAAEEKAILQLARSAGVVVLASSGTEQVATEMSTLGHGLFTYAILAGLSGEADGNKDAKVTVSELKAYLEDRVIELSRQYRGQAQYPNGYSRGQDFPLGVVGR
jgi:hypothetical protein